MWDRYAGRVSADKPAMRQIRPLDPPMVPFPLVGMIVWLVLGLNFLAFRGTLAANGHENWIAICFAGFGWGIPGLALMAIHDRNRKKRRAAAPVQPD